MAERVISRKQSALLSRKKSLMNEIKYYEFKVNEEMLASNNNNLICDDSSDSECEFTVDVGLSVTELKLKQRSLKTCLQATQELTGVTVLQSEVNVLVRDPVLEGECPISEEGVWREVTAECRIDLVPFSINYYVHKPSRMFGPMSYRNLQVTPVKASHEVELAKSILKTIRQPSDAIEIIRNYSAAHRSRRTTLARLAEKYGEALFMVPIPEGGYRLKCAELMEVQWSLQNKWSPLAPFHHRMVFDLEFMDESYIKTISTLHKQIIDPTIDTDDRTLLLAKIINTCLEAKAHITQNQAEESTESESEAAEKLRRRRTTLDQEPQEPERNRKKDSEVMAPPKSLPKKTKPKGKENTTDNKAKPVKRVADHVGEKESAKKAKTTATDKLVETKNTESKTKNTKTKSDKVNKGNNENSGEKVDDQNVIIQSDINPKKAKTTAIDKLIEKKNTESKTKNTKTKPEKVNKDNNENSSEKVDDGNVIMSDINPKKVKTTATDKLIETKNTESKTKNTKTKSDKVNKDNNENSSEKFDDGNVIMSGINPKKAKTTATDKPKETKNAETKTKNTKTKTDKVNKDNNANNGAKFDDANVITSDSTQKKAKATAIDKEIIESKNTESKTKSNKTKRDKNNKDNNANKGEKIDDKNVIMNDKNPKNSEEIRKKSKNKHSDMANDQPITTNNVKESNKSDKSKNTVKDSKHQKAQKLDNKASSNIVTQSTQVNKKEAVEDKSESKQQRKSSANVIKSIKAKQNHDFLKSKELKRSKESVIQKYTKDMKIKALETISKKSIGNKNKQSINNPKLALATKTNKEKSQDTKLPNLIKNSKDVSQKPTTANYLKNSFLPQAANKFKSALPTKIPKISPRKLASIKSNIQDISKSFKTSQNSLQKATNIPRLLKKQQIFKTNNV